jgi:hypothetical protein
LQQAQGVAGYYERMRTNEGWSDDCLLPLLAGVLELLPWLVQWHNGLDPQYGMGLGDFFRSFVEEEARRMGKTLDEVRAWQPPVRTKGRKGDRADQLIGKPHLTCCTPICCHLLRWLRAFECPLRRTPSDWETLLTSLDKVRQ